MNLIQTARIFALVGILGGTTPRTLCAESATLIGKVHAEPRVKAQAKGGGDAYASHALAHAVPFDFKHLNNAIVYAEPTSSGADVSSSASNTDLSVTFIASRYGMAITPDFMTAPTGAEVRFKNNTSNLLVVYAGGASPRSFVLKIDPKSEKRTKLSEIGLYSIGCLEHLEIMSKIFVSGPHYATVDRDTGKYSLTLPPGDYKVTAWHERLPSKTQEVHLESAEKKELNFNLSILSLPEVP